MADFTDVVLVASSTGTQTVGSGNRIVLSSFKVTSAVDFTGAVLTGVTVVGISNGGGSVDIDASANLASTSLASVTLTTAGTGALTIQGGGVSKFGDDTGYIQFGGTGALSTSGVSTFDADCSGAFQINSSGGAISVGNDAVNQNVNIATGGTRTLTLGTTTTTWTAVAAGLTLDSTTLSIDSTDTTNLTMTANNAGTKVMTIAATNAGAGVAQLVISTDGPLDLDAVGVASLNSSGAAINVGNDADNFALNVGTGGTRTITVGSAAATLVLNSSGGDAVFTAKDNSAAGIAFKSGDGTTRVTLDTTNSAEGLVINAADLRLAAVDGTTPITQAGTAGEALAAGDVVSVNGTAAKVFGAEADSGAANLRDPSGIATIASAADGNVARYAIGGCVSVTFDGTVATTDIGKRCYLSGTAKRATLTQPIASGSAVWLLGKVIGAAGSTTAQVLFRPQYLFDIP